MLATLGLLLATPKGPQFWFIFTALCGVAGTQAAFWLVTQPTNRVWLRNQQLGDAGARFFSFDQLKQQPEENNVSSEWRRLRDRWEYSHVIRAGLSVIALTSIVIAVTM